MGESDMSDVSTDLKAPVESPLDSPISTEATSDPNYMAHLATPSHFKHKVMVHDVVRAVAEEFAITFEELQSEARERRISRPRHIATYLARQWTTHSFPYIGFNTGRRDHSSAINSFKVIKRELEQGDNAELVAQIARIKIRLETFLLSRNGLPK